jgi:hypothetical protein
MATQDVCMGYAGDAIAVALGNLFGGKFVDSGVMFPSLTVLIPENGGEF